MEVFPSLRCQSVFELLLTWATPYNGVIKIKIYILSMIDNKFLVTRAKFMCRERVDINVILNTKIVILRIYFTNFSKPLLYGILSVTKRNYGFG